MNTGLFGPDPRGASMTSPKRLKVLIIDDSAIVRRILSEILQSCPEIESVSTAPDASVARSKIQLDKPDVVTLDIEMPGMDGLTFLKEVMRTQPLPVIVISSLAQSSYEPVLEALRLGALEVVAKPGGPYSVEDLRLDLPSKIKAAAGARLRMTDDNSFLRVRREAAAVAPSSAVIALAASTGGVQAIEEVMRGLSEDCPGLVVVQHIPPVFSAALAHRLDQLCAIRVKEANEGDSVTSGLALIAPGNRHLEIYRSGPGYRVALSDSPRVHYQRPSADVLFESVAKAAGADATGVILTGMGSDGAQGLLRMRRAGARTIAQSADTCAVFGMPRAAIQLGAVDQVMALSDIASALRIGVAS
jgi:two-component system chemotaxis response regulator CheB